MLPQGLGHEPRLQPHVGIPHFALDLRLGGEGRYRVHHDHIHGPRAHQHIGNLQGLLAGIRLGHQQLTHLDPQPLRVARIQRMLGIHKGGNPALLLGLGDDLEGQGGLTGRLRAIDLHYPTFGHAAHPQGQVQTQGAGRDDLHMAHGIQIAHAHH
jgi:hypothetical protein